MIQQINFFLRGGQHQRRLAAQGGGGAHMRGVIAKCAETLAVPTEELTRQPVSKREIATGVVHDVPADLRKILMADNVAPALWEDITPLARNEWICWVEDAKKPDTRRTRIERVRTELRVTELHGVAPKIRLPLPK